MTKYTIDVNLINDYVINKGYFINLAFSKEVDKLKKYIYSLCDCVTPYSTYKIAIKMQGTEIEMCVVTEISNKLYNKKKLELTDNNDYIDEYEIIENEDSITLALYIIETISLLPDEEGDIILKLGDIVADMYKKMQSAIWHLEFTLVNALALLTYKKRSRYVNTLLDNRMFDEYSYIPNIKFIKSS